jgi:hypothetical protein
MREMWLKQSTLMVLAYCRVPNGARASSERELAVPA